jgi:hypothetical protein
MKSMVASVLASSTGRRSGNKSTDVPSLILLVAPAAAASAESGSKLS